MRKFKVLVAAFVLFMASAGTVSAAEFLKPTGRNAAINVPSSESHKNLYVAASSVNISAPTTGDLVVAGSNVNLNGTVEKELMAAGSSVTVNGRVGDTARIAGATVNINAPVVGDLIVAGGNVIINSNASIGGDLIVFSGNVTLDAPVAGSVKANGGADGTIDVNSKVSGNFEARGWDRIHFGNTAEVVGSTTLYTNNQPVVDPGAKVANISIHPLQNRASHHGFARLFAIATLLKMIAAFLAALVFFYVFRNRSQGLVAEAHNHPWWSLLVGFIGLIVIPIAFVILLITVVGSYIGLIAFAWYIAALLVSGLVMIGYVGSLIMRWLKQKDDRIWLTLLVGAVVVTIIAFIPFIGGLIIFILMLISFGAILRFAKTNMHA